MMLVFPVDGEEGKANRPFTRKTTLILIYSSAGTMFNHKITGGPISEDSKTPKENIEANKGVSMLLCKAHLE